MSASSDSEHPVVVLVEDDDVLRDSLTRLLRVRSYSVIPVATSTDALAALDFMVPQVVVADYRLGDTNAGALVKTARSKNAGSSIVLISGLDEGADFARSMGITFLRKPFEIEALVTTMEAATRAERVSAG